MAYVIICSYTAHSPSAPIAPTPPPPPKKLCEWYHFVVPHVTSKKNRTDCMVRPFFKMSASSKLQYLGLWDSWDHLGSHFDFKNVCQQILFVWHLSDCEIQRGLILVSMPIVYQPRNSIAIILIALSYLV